MTEIQNLEPYNQNLRLVSFDITNMYTNIPTSQLPAIINKICNYQNTPQKIKRELLKITKIVLKQNYSSFSNSTYRQTDGLAMGAPTSAILSEIYLQFIEHTSMADILSNHNICDYFRYVDDILLIYDTTTTDINTVLEQFNSVTSNLTFILEKKANKVLRYHYQ
jgi:hypothetical protein